MENLERNIKYATQLIEENYKVDDPVNNMFYSIYPFTTENINGYINLFNIKDKDILTVGASGDHTLNLKLNGAKKVDYFDINPFSKYYYELKKAAVISLEYDEFLRFFCRNYPKTFKFNKDALNLSNYRDLSSNLELESKLFWDHLYNKYEGLDIKNSKLFSRDEPAARITKQTNSYLIEENYYKLKEILKNDTSNPNFYESNLFQLSKTLKNNYDMIMLSNIAQYIDDNRAKSIKALKNFKKEILNLENNLNNDGLILLAYLYDIESHEDTKYPIIYNLNEVSKTFPEAKTAYFNGIQSLSNDYVRPILDGVLIHKKTK